MVFTHPTGFATAEGLSLRFYVTIFGIFKQNKPIKSFFLVKNLQIYKVFTPPTGYKTADKAFIVFLCDNIWTF